ncbi:hypothetical protein [Amycolatopsis plumensis]|uniref:Uncharacterized protein n=1 Tax=Amycolatopsis plumensis TaxID=236508 RepID=A0ABV5UFD9_9PSEU
MKLIAKPADLALVGQSRESFVVQRVGFLIVGALWIPVLTVLLAMIGAVPPIVLTGAASVGCALLGWQLPVIVLKSKVKHARAAFAGALAAYCRLVALGRLGDRGPTAASSLKPRLPGRLSSSARSASPSSPSTAPERRSWCPQDRRKCDANRETVGRRRHTDRDHRGATDGIVALPVRLPARPPALDVRGRRVADQ